MTKILLFISILFSFTIYANCIDSITKVNNNTTIDNAYEIDTENFKWSNNELSTSESDSCSYAQDWYKIRVSANNRLSIRIAGEEQSDFRDLDLLVYYNGEIVAVSEYSSSVEKVSFVNSGDTKYYYIQIRSGMENTTTPEKYSMHVVVSDKGIDCPETQELDQPVCGKDGESYFNRCHANNYWSTEVAYEGYCRVAECTETTQCDMENNEICNTREKRCEISVCYEDRNCDLSLNYICNTESNRCELREDSNGDTAPNEENGTGNEGCSISSSNSKNSHFYFILFALFIILNIRKISNKE